MARSQLCSAPQAGFCLVWAGLCSLVGSAVLAFGQPLQAQQAGYGQTLGTSPMERQNYDGTGKPSGGSILDATNPIDLMNKLRRGSAMDDATPPSSAIDQALKDFDAQAAPVPGPAAAVSAQVKAP